MPIQDNEDIFRRVGVKPLNAYYNAQIREATQRAGVKAHHGVAADEYMI